MPSWNTLTGITLERFLQLRRRRLYPEEAMYIAARLRTRFWWCIALTAHYDINARSVFLLHRWKGKARRLWRGEKAGLRARHEVDDTEPWIDLSAIGRTLYEAMTDLRYWRAHSAAHQYPAAVLEFLWHLLETSGYRRIASVFDYRHALACGDWRDLPGCD